MKKALILVFSIVLAGSLVACKSPQKAAEAQSSAKPEPVEKFQEVKMKSIKGVIFYRERIALPKHAVVRITLEDISKADAKSEIVSRQTFQTDGAQVPLDFELSYDANKIEPRYRYAVRVRIEVNGELMFTTDTVHPVITDPAKTTDVKLQLIKAN